jgi:hypothetical protein
VGVDVDEFVDRGFVRLASAVPPAVVAEVRAFAVQAVPAQAAWALGQATVYDLPCLVDALSPPVRAGFDAIVGPGRWFVDAVGASRPASRDR